MEAAEIIKNNELIAKFMGYEKTSSDKNFTFYEHPEGKGIIIQSDYDYERFTTHNLIESRGFLFHRNWQWLMLAIEKIENLKNKTYFVKIHTGGCFIHPLNDTKKYKAKVYGANKLETTYKAVVEFIEWYNTKA